jgi:hypothetical protein
VVSADLAFRPSLPSLPYTYSSSPSGVILLDLKGSTFPEIVNHIVSRLVTSGSLPQESSEQVRTLLLKKHKHSSSDSTLWDRIKHSAAGEWMLHVVMSYPSTVRIPLSS